MPLLHMSLRAAETRLRKTVLSGASFVMLLVSQAAYAPGQTAAGSASLATPPASTSAGQNVAAAIESALSSPAAARAHWGISVVDANTGTTLYARNEGQLFQPASNAKLFTTAAALALLGPGFTMRTTVVAEGPMSADGHLQGPLRLVGGGDPSLSGRAYPYAGKTARDENALKALDDLAAQVAASGIRSVDGPVLGDDTAFAYERYAQGWAWDDLQWDYGAPVSALTVNDNVRYLLVSPGAHAGDPAGLTWNPPAGTGSQPAFTPGADALENLATTAPPGADAHLGLAREVDGGPLVAYGVVALGSKPQSVAVAIHDPAAFAAAAFRMALIAHGVAVSGESAPAHRPARDLEPFARETREPMPAHPLTLPSIAGRLVASRTSPPLRELVTVTNKVSQNLHAELLLRLLGRAQGDDGTLPQGVRVVRQFLVTAGLDPQDFTFFDGSGLSSEDLITPRAATTLLVYAQRQSWGAAYRASLPVGGVDGSLTGRFTTGLLKGRVVAKTGTLSEVNTLSGYLTAASGRSLAFSVLCNDAAGEGNRGTLDGVVAAIAAAF